MQIQILSHILSLYFTIIIYEEDDYFLFKLVSDRKPL